MIRSEIHESKYRPHFTGHETFPLKYGWLKKAYDEVLLDSGKDEGKSIFLSDEAISRFGVGKNMVASIKHWASTTKIIKNNELTSVWESTRLGNLIFNEVDPFMENPSTLWLIHWNLASNPLRTTWFWVFNHFPGIQFDRDILLSNLKALSEKQEWKKTSEATIKRDVECFTRTYASRIKTSKISNEEALESPLTELGIIRSTGKKDGFRFVKGNKPTLKDGVFTYAIIDYWMRNFNEANSLSFEAVTYQPGSVGKVFLLDENGMVQRLVNLEKITDGVISWSETAGLKQIIKRPDTVFDDDLKFKILKKYFSNNQDDE